jgi:DeoR/GlpR family transcriptional regulator of sugar metabolism
MIGLYSVDFNKSPVQDMQQCCKSQAKMLQIFVESFQKMRLNDSRLPENGRLGEPEMSSTTEQRRERILSEADHNGRVSVRDLALALGVSEATVRRDLKSLADDGQLDIVFGGAILPRTLDYSFPSKERRNIENKRIIGALAARLVGDGDQIFMDSGTTCFQMARHLKRIPGLTIVVNSTRLAMEFDSPGQRIIMLGGQYRPDRMDVVGPLAMRALEGLRGYRAFIGADGLSMDFGLSASDIDSAHLHALAVENARETVLLADHSKFLAPSLHKIVDFDRVSQIVTDRRPPDEWMTFFEERGMDVLYPQVEAFETAYKPQGD